MPRINSLPCTFRIHISPREHEFFKRALSGPHEIGHVVFFHEPSSRQTQVTTTSTRIDRGAPGSKTGVDTRIGAINMHSHPRAAYESEKCIVGWPSGEDMREVIRHSLGGTRIHLVYTLEGVYSIMANPCLLEALSTLTDRERGLILGMVEMQFRTLHSQRQPFAVRKAGGASKKIKEFLKYANTFSCTHIVPNSFSNVWDDASQKFIFASVKTLENMCAQTINGHLWNGQFSLSPITSHGTEKRTSFSLVKPDWIRAVQKLQNAMSQCSRPRVSCDGRRDMWTSSFFRVCLTPLSVPPSFTFLVSKNAAGECEYKDVLNHKIHPHRKQVQKVKKHK